MARSHILAELKKLMLAYQVSEATGRPVDEVYEERLELQEQARVWGLSRRQFLISAGALVATAAMPSGMKRALANTETHVPVAIIGAGMAGLAAAIRLKDAGVRAQLFEAQTRVGGRLLTDRNAASHTGCNICHTTKTTCASCHEASKGKDMPWMDDQYVDVYGELIDNPGYWTATWQLASRYWSVDPKDPNGAMVDMWQGYPAGCTDTYFFDNDYYRWKQVLKDFGPVYKAVARDQKKAPSPTTHVTAKDKHRKERQRLDRTSVWQWIEKNVPGGHASPMGKLLDVEYNIEYGADTTKQSALNLIYLLANQPQKNQFSVFGESDERYRLRGGIDRLTTAMADEIGWDNIKLGKRLVRLSQAPDRSYHLHFSDGHQVRADNVLLALPFAALRHHVDFKSAGFDEFKRQTIMNAAVAHNFKMAVQFKSRFWNRSGPWGISNGNLASDTGCQYGWDGSRGLPGGHGILVNLGGGAICDGMRLGHAYGTGPHFGAEDDAQSFLRQLDRIFPGADVFNQWTGKVVATKAHLDTNYLGSYGNYEPGGYTKWCGAERMPSGNVFFAGEHTSIDFFGYFEGAAQEGIGSAEAILARLGIKTPKKKSS